MSCIFCKKLLISDLHLIEQDLTKTYINHNVSIEGRVLVVLKKHIEDESLLSDKENATFFQEAIRVGQILKKIYKPQRINYLLLGNEVSHLHWHLIPRTKESIKKNYFPMEMFNKQIVNEQQEKDLSMKLKKKFETEKFW